MKTTLTLFALLAALVLVPAASPAQDIAPDPTGAWIFDVVTDAGGGMPTVTFELGEDNALTGHYSSETLGEADLKGTLMETDIRFTFVADLQGFPVDVTYEATMENANLMRGTIDIGGLAGGTFTGRRRPADGAEAAPQ